MLRNDSRKRMFDAIYDGRSMSFQTSASNMGETKRNYLGHVNIALLDYETLLIWNLLLLRGLSY